MLEETPATTPPTDTDKSPTTSRGTPPSTMLLTDAAHSTLRPGAVDVANATFGTTLALVARSQSYVKIKLSVSTRSTVDMTLLAEAASPELAAYWREGVEPTYTRYNFTEAFNPTAK